MKGFLGGICAGVAVGAIGLAVGLTLVPARDHEAIRGADHPAAVEQGTIFDEDPDIAPVDQAQDDAEAIFAPADDDMDVPAATISDGVEQDSASEVGGDVPPSPSLPEEISIEEPAAAVPAAVVKAAELGPDAASEEVAPETAEAPPADPAEALTPPAAQTLAPRAPSSDALRTGRPDLTVAPAGEGSRDEAETQPAALTVPEAGLVPPDFDGGLPTPPEPLADGNSAWAEDDRPALVRNAVAAPPSWAAPLLSVVVVDRPGTDPIEGVPLSVAIAADAEDAQGRADAWRAAGAEIVAIPSLPAGAAGTGPLALFDATFDALPQAATIMAGSAQGFAGGPMAADEIAATLAETGHGLILRSGTSAPLAQAAERAGVPTAGIFRRVDGSGRDGRAVGRFLDQAAFEARNRGAVVVIADNSPETAEGLERFLESSRADSVVLVPVSAILRAQ